MAYWYKNSIKLTKACIVLNILYRTPRLINSYMYSISKQKIIVVAIYNNPGPVEIKRVLKLMKDH